MQFYLNPAREQGPKNKRCFRATPSGVRWQWYRAYQHARICRESAGLNTPFGVPAVLCRMMYCYDDPCLRNQRSRGNCFYVASVKRRAIERKTIGGASA